MYNACNVLPASTNSANLQRISVLRASRTSTWYGGADKECKVLIPTSIKAPCDILNSHALLK